MTLADPDALVPASPRARAYIAEVERLATLAPPPTARFAYGEDRAQYALVHAPADARDAPILVFLHGGAWVSGHPGWASFMAGPLNALGIILVAPTYRLAPRCRWPAQLDDARAALRATVARADEWGGNPGRVIVGGHSAGGHLAAHLALDPNASPPLAAFTLSAPFDLRHGDVPDDDDRSRVYRYLLEQREDDAAASPIIRVAEAVGSPAFDIGWARRDLAHVRAASAPMVAALRAHGCAVDVEESDADHFDTHIALAHADAGWYRRLHHAFGEASR